MKRVPALGEVVSFDEFDYQTERERVMFPLYPAPTLFTEIELEWDEFTQAPRVKSRLEMVTMERTPDGWKRVR